MGSEMRQLVLLVLFALVPLQAADDGWVSLFNGKDLTGWKVEENPATFSVQDGAIVAQGPRSHLFYDGDVQRHAFTDFELKVDVMTLPRANGGIYILTEFQASGWPEKGFEVQVNNSYPGDPRRTGSLYEILDVPEVLVKDNVWFTEHILVKGSTIVVRVNDQEVVRWTQPAGWAGTSNTAGRRIAPGTIALQGHDAGSTTRYKNILIKPLK
jgi:hypothetical protein